MRWLLMLPVLALAALVQAQEIAVLDAQKVVQTSEIGKKKLAEIKALRNEKQAQIDKQRDSIQKMQDTAAGQKAINDLNRLREDSEKEIRTRMAKTLNEIEGVVIPIVQKIAKDRGYAIVLSKEQIVYLNPKIDITDEVIRTLNASTAGPQTPPKKP